MANEPERPIERLLRAAAEKRRADAGAPLELHPADRRLLQGEVGRVFAKASEKPRGALPFPVWLWPRLAWAAATFAVLAVAVALLVPNRGEPERHMRLAQDSRMAAPAPTSQAMPAQSSEAAAIPPEPAMSLKTKDATLEQPSPAAAPAATRSKETIEQQDASPPLLALAPAEAPAAPSKAPAEAFAVAPSGGLKSARSTGMAESYLRQTTEPSLGVQFVNNQKASQPVLVSFQVEQSGRELKITDSDGSVYSGQVLLAQAPRSAAAARNKAPSTYGQSRAAGTMLETKAVADRQLSQLAPQNYTFRVSGTNRTLGKNVVFTGDLVTGTNLIVSQRARTDALADKVTVPPLLQSRITGKVVVGTGKAVQLEAVPATSQVP